MHQFQNGDTVAGSQIDGLHALVGRRVFQCFQMAYRQINHMEVVPLAGAVWCGIVAAEDRQLFQLSCCHATDVWHQVIGNSIGIISQQAGLVGTNGIEIPQQDSAEVRVGSYIVRQNPLNHHLRPAIGRRGLDGGHLFFVGMGIVGAVDRGGGGEDELFAAEFLHNLQQCHGAVQVVSVILQRLFHALTHGLEACEVNHGIDLVVFKNRAQRLAICTVNLIKGRFTTGNRLDSVNHIRLGVGEIVHNDHIVSGVQQLHHGVAADVSRAARYQYIHVQPS